MRNGDSIRLVNLDALRSLSMLMVVIWHFFFYAIGSGSFPVSLSGTINYAISELIVISSNVCVNIFVLIAGYFLLDRKFHTKRVLLLWFEVVFYSLGITLIGALLSEENVNFESYLYALFPITSDSYWFFTDYFGLVILAPFLSKTAMALTQKEYIFFLMSLVILCCTFSLSIPLGNTMGASKGYSLLWFIALFFWGAYYKRFGTCLTKRKCRMFLLLTVGFVFLFCVGKTLYRFFCKGTYPEIEFIAYNGFAFPLSILLFLFFLNLSCRSGFLPTLLSSVSPYSFGVYLITEHYLVRPFLWNNCIPWLKCLDAPWFIPLSLTFCVLVFFISIGIDWVRNLFFKIIHLPRFSDNLIQWVSLKVELIRKRI